MNFKRIVSTFLVASILFFAPFSPGRFLILLTFLLVISIGIQLIDEI